MYLPAVILHAEIPVSLTRASIRAFVCSEHHVMVVVLLFWIKAQSFVGFYLNVFVLGLGLGR